MNPTYILQQERNKVSKSESGRAANLSLCVGLFICVYLSASSCGCCICVKVHTHSQTSTILKLCFVAFHNKKSRQQTKREESWVKDSKKKLCVWERDKEEKGTFSHQTDSCIPTWCVSKNQTAIIYIVTKYVVFCTLILLFSCSPLFTLVYNIMHNNKAPVNKQENRER